MREDRILSELEELLGNKRIKYEQNTLSEFEVDYLENSKGKALALVLPNSATEISAIVRICNKYKIKYLARGGGTSLSGGSLPLDNCIIIDLSKMNRILEVNFDEQTVLAEPGVINIEITNVVDQKDLLFAPDPSSQHMCTVGGNIAHNAGGAHTIKYGVTTNHVLSVEIVLPNGEITNFGNGLVDGQGYDLLALINGSDGTLGIITKALLRVIPKPASSQTILLVFDRVKDASKTVSDIIRKGILPSALEMMDRIVIRAIEKSEYKVGIPINAEAALLVEVDGRKTDVSIDVENIIQICNDNNVRTIQRAKDQKHAEKLWAARKSAFEVVGKQNENYIVQDGVIPRTMLPQTLEKIYEIGKKYDLPIANVFHAGDGNLHPLILFNGKIKKEKTNAIDASIEIIKICADAGGSITGEHGIGIEKVELMPYMFNKEDIELMTKIKMIFDPGLQCNPCKVLPSGSKCMELSAKARE